MVKYVIVNFKRYSCRNVVIVLKKFVFGIWGNGIKIIDILLFWEEKIEELIVIYLI